MKNSKLMLVLILAMTGLAFWACNDDEPQTLTFKGVEIAAKGEANIEETNGTLVVSNLGTSQGNAISVKLPESKDSYEMEIDFADESLEGSLPNGAKRITSYKSEDGDLLSQKWIEKMDNNRIIGFNYPEIDSLNIELYRNGEVVDVIEGFTGNTITMKQAPIGANQITINCICIPHICYPEGCVYCCSCSITTGFILSIDGHSDIDGIRVIPVITEGYELEENIPTTLEISTKNIETIRIKDISFQ